MAVTKANAIGMISPNMFSAKGLIFIEDFQNECKELMLRVAPHCAAYSVEKVLYRTSTINLALIVVQRMNEGSISLCTVLFEKGRT